MITEWFKTVVCLLLMCFSALKTLHSVFTVDNHSKPHPRAAEIHFAESGSRAEWPHSQQCPQSPAEAPLVDPKIMTQKTLSFKMSHYSQIDHCRD